MSEKPVVLVTGGADGIGWAVARRFAAGGYRVAIADLRGAAAEGRAGELGASFITGVVLSVDGGWTAIGVAGDAPEVCAGDAPEV